MIPILTNPTLLICATIILYIILAIPLVRSIRRSYNSGSDVYVHNVYIEDDQEETESDQEPKYDYVIETSRCDFCNRIDKIHVNLDKLRDICSESNIGIGEITISHETHEYFSHTITYYVDQSGIYHGGRIPASQIKHMVDLSIRDRLDNSSDDESTDEDRPYQVEIVSKRYYDMYSGGDLEDLFG